MEASQNLDVYIPVIRAHTGRAVGMSSSARHLAAGRRRPAVFGAHFPHQESGGLQEAEPPAFRVLSYYALLPLLFLRTLRFCFLPGGPPEPPASV